MFRNVCKKHSEFIEFFRSTKFSFQISGTWVIFAFLIQKGKPVIPDNQLVQELNPKVCGVKGSSPGREYRRQSPPQRGGPIPLTNCSFFQIFFLWFWLWLRFRRFQEKKNLAKKMWLKTFYLGNFLTFS